MCTDFKHRLWEPDPEKLHDEMIARFKAADLDGNGVSLLFNLLACCAFIPLTCAKLAFRCTGVIDRHELRVLLEGFEDGKVAPGEVGNTRAQFCTHFFVAYLPTGSAYRGSPLSAGSTGSLTRRSTAL